MATSTARTVKDVNPHEFVKSYSAHLKRSGKVLTSPASRCPPRSFGSHDCYEPAQGSRWPSVESVWKLLFMDQQFGS